MKLEIYDFDGTITNKDSFLEFLKFMKGRKKYYFFITLISPAILLYFIGIIPNWKLKEFFLSVFLKNTPIEEYNRKCNIFAEKVLPGIIKKQALQNIINGKSTNNKIIIVSASLENYIARWAENYDIQVVATKVDVKNGKLTGRINGKNCYGKEKVIRLKRNINIRDFDEISVYGDSKGDKELLSIATKRFYKYFQK